MRPCAVMRISFSSMVDSFRGRSTLWYRSISAAGADARRPACCGGARDSRGGEEGAAAGDGEVAAAGAKTLDGANDTVLGAHEIEIGRAHV